MTKLWHVGKDVLPLNIESDPKTLCLPCSLSFRFNTLDFSENDFSGHLPTEAIAKLVNLQKFHVHQSGRGGPGITGKLPSFKEQTKLHMLDLNSNAMTGSIPSNFLSGVEDVDQLMAIE